MPASARDMDWALSPAEDGILADTAARIGGEPEQSAFVLVERADDALIWRLALIDSATESLDVMYSVWKGDDTGTLVFSRVIEAAQRGVRIRLLVDDLDLEEPDEVLATLDQHPNIAINLWDPTMSSSTGALSQYTPSFDELNKRMHNRMILADGHFGIAGGRNVANEYFGLHDKYNYFDLDVLAVGPVAADMAGAFDQYWTGDPSVSMSEIARAKRLANLADFVAEGQQRIDESKELLARFPIRRKDWEEKFRYLPERWHVGFAQYFQDDPIGAGEESRPLDMIDLTTARVRDELYIVSPYLIPVGDMLNNMRHLVADGVVVKVVTGTMESAKHTASYAHYRTDIGAILDTGAELYEVDGQPMANVREAANTPPVEGKFSALHLKGMVGDREKCFIGSLNLDPRALVINTDPGLYIESAGLGGALVDWLDEVISPENAWRVVRDEGTGKPSWQRPAGSRSASPDRGPVQRFAADFLESLPIKTQL